MLCQAETPINQNRAQVVEAEVANPHPQRLPDHAGAKGLWKEDGVNCCLPEFTQIERL